MTGPAAELKATYLRINALARAIRSGNLAAFADQLPAEAIVDDDRGIDALMYDIFTRTDPQAEVQIIATDTTTGETTSRTLDLDEAIALNETLDADVSHAPVAHADAAAPNSPDDASNSDAGPIILKTVIRANLSTHGQFFADQAKMITTVPVLTLLGLTDLPGTFSDGTPIPAETARMLAGHSKTWTRILTDPATGTPIDAKATSYHIPADVRTTLIAEWQGCTAPGCLRRAETSEIDHIIPFDHDHPEQGGLTVFSNLHPLCKADHQAKTDRRFSVRMTPGGDVEYTFRHGVTAIAGKGDNPINIEHARLFGLLPASAADPPEEDSPPSTPQPGDRCRAAVCPEPAGGPGRPGWVEAAGFVIWADSNRREWVWVNGDRPPFDDP